ncbi:hypothetical protein SEUCBS139899_008235 [Sporothrix eucalyptigena]|uniref:Peptidase S1 domain-containing protein n=1 Tax=Sporothrix eucalyptigena TaxID=1812306 RepID=A0ABP0CGB9_9PEZI
MNQHRPNIKFKEGLPASNNSQLTLHVNNLGIRPAFDSVQWQSYVVTSQAAGSGQRYSVTNEIEAVVRGPDNTVQRYLIVIGIPDDVPSRIGTSSAMPGDSGACVFDTTGLALGMVHAGHMVKQHIPDVINERAIDHYQTYTTFATHMRCIFEDI